jgi:hypothetical protein
VKGGKVNLKQAVLVVQVEDAARDGVGLVVRPVVVLGVDWGLPDVPLGPVQRRKLKIILSKIDMYNYGNVCLSDIV